MSTFPCPKCGNGDTKVMDSRTAKFPAGTRRRRECVACKDRFTTHEIAEVHLKAASLYSVKGARAILSDAQGKVSEALVKLDAVIMGQEGES